ncbi:MAG: FecR domain-containing protein [Bacteroidia bacterium]|nr:FecR domain-containing protein [Bacteroidia bacterium]
MKEEKLSAKEKAAITRDLFERYRRGETSPIENEVIESLEPAFIPEKEFEISDELLDTLETETTDFIFKRIEKPKKRTLSPVLIGAVASIALLVVGLFLFQKNNTSKKLVAETAIENITLADGSQIILNAGTAISYNSAREVWLHEGEACFDVTADSLKPFLVHLRDGLSVRVLGTSFTIQSYAELPFLEVAVLSGKVKVSTRDKQSAELVADEKAVYRDAKLSQQPTNAQQKALWRTGTVVLENASFAELRLRIRQLFGKTIVFERVPENISIHTILHKEASAEEIAREIATLYGFAYRVSADEIVFYPQ